MRNVRIGRLVPALFVLMVVLGGLQGIVDDDASRWALLAASASLALAGMVLVNRRVARPLDELADASRRLAADDTGAAVPHADRSDEIGALAAGLAAIRDAAAERQRLDRRNEDDRRRAEG
ncbi:HAMP domain-containing protein, partial [Shinella sp.]|uniref:HAMP domain-containing protein n=1 Tax=Shinella sp. TaxID=1870904 RepID=UPI0039E3DF2E